MNQSSGLSVIALIIGIISIPIGCLTYAWIGLIVGVVGLVFSILAKKKDTSKIVPTAMICSIIGIVMSVANIIIVIMFYVIATR